MDNIFYVYVHRKPNGEVFYVGKGKGKRACSKARRNRYWRNTVDKYGYTVSIVDDCLPESQAFELEKFLISLYGRKEKGGRLVNLTDGGDGASGYVATDETRAKLALANSDDTICDFVNFHTGEKYTGTRQQFVTTYSIDVSSLFRCSRTCLTVKGWCLLENLDKITTPRYDCRLHKFIHISGEIVVATREEFRTKTGVDTNCLFRNGNQIHNSTQGWCLEGNVEKIYLCDKHDIVHRFENKDGVIIQATRSDFKIQTGIDPERLFGKHKRRSTFGWCLEGNSEKIKIIAHTNEVHTFIHNDGITITSTRTEFKERTGIETRGLFGKKAAKVTKTGWSLLPTQP